MMLPKVYIFTGDDIVGKEAAKKAAVRAIEAEVSSFQRKNFNPLNESFGDFLGNLLTPSLFGDVRIASINHAEELKEDELDELDRVIGHPADDVYIIIDIGEQAGRKDSKTDPRKKLHIDKRSKIKDGLCICRNFQKPREYQAAQWLSERVPEIFGRSIDTDAAELLVDLVGCDTAVLFSEVEKIDVNLENKRNIDRKAVEEFVGRDRIMTPFELADSLCGRNIPRSIQIIKSIFSSSHSIQMILGVLYRRYSALLRIRHYLRKNPQDKNNFFEKSSFHEKNRSAMRIGIAAGLLHEGEESKVYPVIIKSGVIEQALKYSDRELERIILMLSDFDIAVKTGIHSDSRLELELLCYRLLRISELSGDGEYI